MEPERSGLALVRHPALAVDQVETVRPRRVGAFWPISKFIENRRNFDTQLAYAGAGDEGSLLFISRAGEDDLVLEVALHLPHVARMRLGDVHHQKLNLIPILLIELVESGHLPPEWRSGITAKHEHDRAPLCGQGR